MNNASAPCSHPAEPGARTVYMAFGLQSGGSTIISYCFLQHPDLAGVLDCFHDRLPEPGPPDPGGRAWWCKATIASFRASETIGHLEGLGHRVRPLLILRDVRQAFNSLLGKPYGRNATTAEDPPLRLRMVRFLEDWHWFVERGLPVMRYEDFVDDPEPSLRAAATALGLPWDDAMLTWPRPPGEVWNGMAASRSFLATLGPGLAATLRPGTAERPLTRIARDDLAWVEDRFAAFNAANGYPARTPDAVVANLPAGRDPACFEAAGRYARARRNRILRRTLGPVRALGRLIGRPDT